MKIALFNAEYGIKNGKPEIYLIGRNKNRERKVFIIHNFFPYFYGEKAFNVASVREIDRIVLNTLYDKNKAVYKFTLTIPANVRKRKKSLTNIPYETEIEFVLRYLIDKGIYSSFEVKDNELIPCEDLNIKPKVCFLDIEILSSGSVPSPLIAREKISVIGLQDRDTRQKYMWTLTTVDKPPDDVIHYEYEDEKTLLNDFRKFFIDNDYDIVAGWNIQWDIGYMRTRMRRYGLPYYKMSPINQFYWDERRNQVRLRGRTLLDLYPGVQKLRRTEPPRKLDILMSEPPFNIYNPPIRNFFKTWIENPKKIINRNHIHVTNLSKLDDYYGIVDFLDELRKIAGGRFLDAKWNSRLIDILMLREGRRRGVILPGKEYIKRETYKAAIILKPKRGIHDNIAVFDFRKAYPAIIIAFNIGPDTKIVSGRGKDRKIEFRKDEDSILSTVCKRIIEEENQKIDLIRVSRGNRRQMLKNQRNALKYLRNAIYGVMAYPNFRIHDLDVVKEITRIARELLQYVVKVLRSHGYIVIAGDTDSIFVNLNKFNVGEAEEILRYANEACQTYLQDGLGLTEEVSKGIGLGLEKIYKTLIIKEKKHYAGLIGWEDGVFEESVEVKGVAAIRGDASYLAKKLQNKCLRLILDKEDTDTIKSYVKKHLNMIKKGEVRPTHIGVPKTLKKEPWNYAKGSLQTKAWNNAKKYLRKHFMKQDRPLYIYLDYPKVIFFDEDKDIEGFNIDYNKMIKHSIKTKLESILELVNLSWLQVEHDIVTLDRFINH